MAKNATTSNNLTATVRTWAEQSGLDPKAFTSVPSTPITGKR